MLGLGHRYVLVDTVVRQHLQRFLLASKLLVVAETADFAQHVHRETLKWCVVDRLVQRDCRRESHPLRLVPDRLG